MTDPIEERLSLCAALEGNPFPGMMKEAASVIETLRMELGLTLAQVRTLRQRVERERDEAENAWVCVLTKIANAESLENATAAAEWELERILRLRRRRDEEGGDE